jgi:hypothetical protein
MANALRTINPRDQPPANSAEVPVKTKPSWILICSGLLLAICFVAGLVVSYHFGSKETVVGTPGTTQTIKTGTNSVTSTTQANQTTIKKGVPSDTLLQGLLATGAILVVVGVLYGRITVIKFPVGEIDLNPDEAKKVAAEAQQKSQTDGASPETMAGVTATALAEARAQKRANRGTLSSDDITQAVNKAAAGYLQIVGQAPGPAAQPESSELW